jgi:hypothetical protein
MIRTLSCLSGGYTGSSLPDIRSILVRSDSQNRTVAVASPAGSFVVIVLGEHAVELPLLRDYNRDDVDGLVEVTAGVGYTHNRVAEMVDVLYETPFLGAPAGAGHTPARRAARRLEAGRLAPAGIPGPSSGEPPAVIARA